MKFKAGDIVTGDFHFIEGREWVLDSVIFKSPEIAWRAYENGKPKTDKHACNIFEKGLRIVKRSKNAKSGYAALPANILIKLVAKKNKEAIQEFIKRYKKMPNI